ncbi:RES family NAD+ phosphorylase [Emcibacter sp.]|uniref:RES family NAD+ phosphorylase n=1 Tax=Emcibacter sp. TaxID=1979954 RepID=UPI002AA87D90|nr:RES family NAD+ phosphorylase [Emcibacter sp.]
MWTADALSSEARSYRRDIWRLVEFQHKSATMRLTDTLEDQALLEDILEESKPALPVYARTLDFLLFTPFRYVTYPHGSRFRRAGDLRGVYYASETVTTAVAEAAWGAWLFFRDSPETVLPENPLRKTAFSVLCRTDRLIDLALPPLDRDAETWMSPEDYSGCQIVAETAREAAIDVIGYRSVRDPEGGKNVAVLTPDLFRGRKVKDSRTWEFLVRRPGVRAWCDLPAHSREYRFA